MLQNKRPPVSEIKPKEKYKSDFFSWNLYRFLSSKNPRNNELNKIFKNPDDGFLYIGEKHLDDWGVSGFRLRTLCSGSGKGKFPTVYAYMNSKNWEDITDEFFDLYMKIGVCAIHGDFAHSFIEKGNKRECEYCGKLERKYVKVVEKEYWR